MYSAACFTACKTQRELTAACMQVREPSGNLMLPGLPDPDDLDYIEIDYYELPFIPGDPILGTIHHCRRSLP